MARSGLPREGIAVALKGEFEDIHGDGSTGFWLSSRSVRRSTFCSSRASCSPSCRRVTLPWPKGTPRGTGGGGRCRRGLGLLLPLAQHLEQLGHGARDG